MIGLLLAVLVAIRADAQPAVRVTDILPGSTGAIADGASAAVVNDVLYFAATDGTRGTELWRSDGTAAGTFIVKDIRPGANGSGPAQLTSHQGALYFVADDGTSGRELWRSDGTAAGTALVKDVDPAGNGPVRLLSVGPTLYFWVAGSSTTMQLWRSDGMADGTLLVKSGIEGAAPTDAVGINEAIFFFAADRGLWKSDGTAEGTLLFFQTFRSLDFTTGVGGLRNRAGVLDYVSSFHSTYGGSPSSRDLLETDGTSTRSIGTGLDDVASVTSVGSRLFFVNGSFVSNSRTYVWDGTSVLGLDGLAGVGFTPLGDQVLFATSAGLSAVRSGPATTLLRALPVMPTQLQPAFGLIFFGGNEGAFGEELWRSDGTAAGTWLFQDLRPGPEYSSPRMLGVTGAGLFLSADDGAAGRELWLVPPPSGADNPKLTIADAAVAEGNTGTRALTFTVTLSRASTSIVTATYSTAGDTAQAGSDYVSGGGTLTFAPGVLSQMASVDIKGDTTYEDTEQLFVWLGAPVGADIARGQAVGRILNDDPRPQPVWHSFFAVDPLETPMVGDFNGDRRTDIITFTRQNPLAVGDVYVALSDGTGFGANTKWHDWFAISTDETIVVGDYDGDGRDDIATWLGTTTRQAYVALSTGAGMMPERVWSSSIGFAASDVLQSGDVDGDGKDDLILFARTAHSVWVARSTGSAFQTPVRWHGFFAVSTSERPRVADVNGDGKADIVTFATDSPASFGDVYVALSNGTLFVDAKGIPDNSTKWHDWFAIQPSEQVRIGDLNGDSRDDFFTFLPPPFGQCYTAASLGTSMGPSVLWRELVVPLGTDIPYVGDVNGDGKADVIVFARNEGWVYVSLAP
jgi:ELWxxDGT repeat protein